MLSFQLRSSHRVFNSNSNRGYVCRRFLEQSNKSTKSDGLREEKKLSGQRLVRSTSIENDELSKRFNKIHRFDAGKITGASVGSPLVRNCSFSLLKLQKDARVCFHVPARGMHDTASSLPPLPPAHMELAGFWVSLADSEPVQFTQNAIVSLHSAMGLPWWATIILTTWTLRALVTLPLALYQNRILARYYNLTEETNEIVKLLKFETNVAVDRFKWPEKYARAIYNRSLKKERQKLIERDNCHPMKSAILILVQIPMWITLSAALRNLVYMLPYRDQSAYELYMQLTTGGFGWITNLTVSDGTLVLPISLGLLNLSIIEIQSLMSSSEKSKAQKYLTNLFRFVSIGMIPLATYVPTAISLYWVSSSAFGVFQNFVLFSPRVRRLAGIPRTDREPDEPYKYFFANLRRRIGLKQE